MSLTCPITFHSIEDNTIYLSNNCGPFKIIKDLGNIKESSGKFDHYVNIQFLKTGTIKTVRLSNAKIGNVKDELSNLNIGKVFYNIFYGPYIILSYEGVKNKNQCRYVKIRFFNSGYERIVTSYDANTANVSDKSVSRINIKPTYGTFDLVDYDRQLKALLRDRWHDMMKRCYDPNNPGYYDYGAKGVTVNPLWHTLEGFLYSIESVKGYYGFYTNPAHYQLDKDYLQRNLPKSKREYGPFTCIFLTEYENNIVAKLDNYLKGSEYFGVTDLGNGRYKVDFSINNNKIYVGIYNNLAAAVSEYEYEYAFCSSLYNPHPSHYDINLSNIFHKNLKGLELMDHEEAIKYKIR